MKSCSDFSNEKSAMAHLFLQISRKADPTLSMLTSPKYHCEVLGGGHRVCLGDAEALFLLFWIEKKNTKKKFNDCVRECVEDYIKKKCY